MAQYIDKDALIAEIKKIKSYIGSDKYLSDFEKGCNFGREDVCDSLLNFIDNLEVKEVDLEKEIKEQINKYYDDCEQKLKEMDDNDNDFSFITLDNFAKHFFELGLKAQKGGMIEALRTEYEKGRTDVIADTISWLENCWSKYCSNQTIIEGFKEAIKRE